MSDQAYTFKPVKAKLRLEVDGAIHEFRRPSVGELEDLEQEIALDGASSKYVQIYRGFFEKLGLKSEVVKSLDYDDLINFIQFVVSPKKKE